MPLIATAQTPLVSTTRTFSGAHAAPGRIIRAMRSVLLYVASGAALHSNHQSAPLLPQPDRRLFIRAAMSTAASVPAVASASHGPPGRRRDGPLAGRAFELSLPKPELPGRTGRRSTRNSPCA